ncbi:motile sperm domain-containing protein 2 [Micropterus dolomieu]|uniref:motile sperm domain-containing protein 2 n=1 Tax=Micropterus dolomieu TaxID=147949 RepID=UPI001E8D3074|nr:motile sperm domain-containing protein 2 [Micropterus dolomieu]XP_045909636.1 motile sperm domain-containing protein 2 [Micropterus dolomieu]
MAELDQHEGEQDIEKKIEETRQRFKNEFLQDSTDKYDSRDLERLQTDDALVEGYLTWRLYVVDDALKMIDESLQWRKEYGLNDLTESTIPKWMFETGAVYLHGYDKEGNKLFWFKVKLHVKDAKTIMDKKKYVAFWLERYAKKEPGMPLTVVFDMTESGLSNIDMEFVKYIINCFKVYYPKFLSKMIIVEMPWIMNAAWKIVKSWLGPEAISKLKFASRSEIQTFIGPEYLPPHMGGMDPFKYSYPPLPDDDFQTPICENGPIVSEDEMESKEGDAEGKDALESSFNSEVAVKPKKVNFLEDSLRAEDNDKGDASSKTKGARKPLTTFKGPLLDVSPSEELSFGSGETEKKSLIILSNVTKNQVAYKVRTTAPEKYRVKPSSSCCEPGASVDIVVSLHGGSQASPQDRFLVMAAEMDNVGSQELAHFWKEVPKTKIMEHRLRCHVLESFKPTVSPPKDSPVETGTSGQQELGTALMRMMACNSRLEQKLNTCLWVQKVLIVLVLLLVVLNLLSLFWLDTSQQPSLPPTACICQPQTVQQGPQLTT